ncbi:hypothetical protein Hanom_Chr07g00659971 [Helianthus anomalus]
MTNSQIFLSKVKEPTLTCVLGNCDVRKVSCVSSPGLRRGTLKISAVWSHVAAVDVIR